MKFIFVEDQICLTRQDLADKFHDSVDTNGSGEISLQDGFGLDGSRRALVTWCALRGLDGLYWLVVRGGCES